MAEWAVEHEIWPKRRAAVIEALCRHKQHGRRVLVVTGLFEPYVEVLLQRLPGFEAIGTPVAFENGKLSGRLLMPFCVGQRKAELLRPFMRYGKIHSAFGDSVDDSYMLAASYEPVAVFPDRRLRNMAEARAWRIMAE
jgi:phosphoserine phosphatase